MKKIFALTLLLVTFIQLSIAQDRKPATKRTAAKTDSVWMLTYFRQRYPTRIEINEKGETVEVPLPNPMLSANLHIALSKDGRHWDALNNNKPIWDRFMRDQYIHRGADGTWRLIATGGGGGPENRKNFGPSVTYATSKNLINWKFEKYIHLMKDVKDEAGNFVGNIWAPEFYYDQNTKEYTIFWSSTFKDAGWKESRLWYCQTKDWETFSPAKLMFDPPYSVIDGTMITHQGTYYLFHKEEEFGAKTGERRGIRVATAKNIEGPYKIYEGPLNKGQIAPTITEGPSVMKDPLKKGWLLLYDYPMVDQYGISSSTDLFNWKLEKNTSMPDDARHGSVSRLSAAEAKALLKAFPSK
ncbi:glycoside hydrolase family 43 protein [Pedobacter sp. G11]|uniref:glycoside hydrolase family 43 protein n=1 Tax=Pedobacter sp. G11 TaxID=2482728 RepID=UPI001FEE7757|nr:glycoside hydrolase family 43 protein [Pedobacter sp. G11]